MWRLWLPVLALVALQGAPVFGQIMPEVPGPGGLPMAPGAPVRDYTPGGIGPGGVEIAPGAAARDIPMYRTGPGGVMMAPRPDPRHRDERTTALPGPGCGPDGLCLPEGLPYTLQLTIHSRDAGTARAPARDTPINSIAELFAALSACWEPPAREHERAGMEMSVRFSLRRSGELMGEPFVTYATSGTPAPARQVYRAAIAAALGRCAPLPLSESFRAAIVGRPISVRYVDDRSR
jgi:hypothetical protein